jgi:hypothetical protein
MTKTMYRHLKIKLYLVFLLCRIFNRYKVISFYSGLDKFKMGEIRHDYKDGRVMIKINNKYCLIVHSKYFITT